MTSTRIMSLLVLLLAGPLSTAPLALWNPFAAVSDSFAWVTVRVDSLNLGNISCDHHWIYDDSHFRSEAQLPTSLLGSGQSWTELEEEGICMTCLRREWSAEKRVPRPQPKSEFERLRERLNTESAIYGAGDSR